LKCQDPTRPEGVTRASLDGRWVIDERQHGPADRGVEPSVELDRANIPGAELDVRDASSARNSALATSVPSSTGSNMRRASSSQRRCSASNQRS
jgi:hypothetical protein